MSPVWGVRDVRGSDRPARPYERLAGVVAVNRIRARERLLAAVQEGLRQSEAGQSLSSEQVDLELDRALGAAVAGKPE